MGRLLIFSILLAVFNLGSAFNKYGRTCQDIGCSSNEVCVMEEKPCTYYSNNECGKYPTCRKVSNAMSTCETYVCPPSQICRMDGGQPKCFDDPTATGNRQNRRPVQNYNPGSPGGITPGSPGGHTPNAPSYPVNPNYPQTPNPYNPNQHNVNGGSLYPQIPSGHGQTTPRPNVYQPGQHQSGAGYQGGQIGSGYPGTSYSRPGSGYPSQGGGYPSQGGGYPNQGSGYPSQGGYPKQQGGYPSQGGYPGYPNQGGGYPGYPTQGGGYPSQGSGYPGYNNQGSRGGYNQGHGNTQTQQSNSNPILDKITDTLKTIGTNFLKETFKVRL